MTGQRWNLRSVLRAILFSVGLVLPLGVFPARHSAEEKFPDKRINVPVPNPGRQKAVDKYIADVQDEDFEECFRKLQGTENLLMFVGSFENAPRPESTFQRCLADRRLAKVYEELDKQGLAVVQARLSEFHRDTWNRYSEDIESVVQDWEKHGKGITRKDLSGNYRVLCASVFLLNVFAEQKALFEAIDEWEVFSAGILQRVFGNPKLSILTSEINSFCPLEPLYLVNIYSARIEDRCGKSAAEVFENLTPRPVEAWKTAFTGWDAKIGSYDWNHRRDGFPVDETRVLRHFEVIRSWDSGDVRTEKQKRIVINALRSKLTTCEGKK